MILEFSIIIPTANRPELLAKCLEEVCRQTEQHAEIVEIIISDDSLSEKTNDQLRLNYPELKWMLGPRRGPAANRNFAASKAIGNWLLFIDDDCIPADGWFDAYHSALSQNDGIVVFEGKTEAIGIRERFDQVAPVNEQGGNLWSCNFLIENSFFNELHGFDESFPYPAMEDVDLCMRIRKKTNIVFIKSAIVFHPWRLMKPFSMFKKHLRSHIILAKKHHVYFTFPYRWSRLKIFIGHAISEFLILRKFSFRGKLAYCENFILNFFLIFV